MKALTRRRRLFTTLSTSAIALCLIGNLPELPGFDLPENSAFAKQGGGKSGKGDKGGKSDKGGKGDRGDKGDKGEKGSAGDKGAGGGTGGGGPGGQAEAAGPAQAGVGGPAAALDEQATATDEDVVLPQSRGGDDFDRRSFSLDSAPSISTTAGLNRFLWILPPEAVTAAPAGRAPDDPVGVVVTGQGDREPGGQVPRAFAAVESPSKVVGTPVPLNAVLAVPLDLAPKPGNKPFAVKLAPKPAAKPLWTEARMPPPAVQAEDRAEIIVPSRPSVRGVETASERLVDGAAQDPSVEGAWDRSPPETEAVIFGVDDAPPEIGAETPGAGGGATEDVSSGPPAYDAPGELGRAGDRARETGDPAEDDQAAAPAEEQPGTPEASPPVQEPTEERAGRTTEGAPGVETTREKLPAPHDGTVEPDFRLRKAKTEGPGLGEQIRGAITQTIDWSSSFLSGSDEES